MNESVNTLVSDTETLTSAYDDPVPLVPRIQIPNTQTNPTSGTELSGNSTSVFEKEGENESIECSSDNLDEFETIKKYHENDQNASIVPPLPNKSINNHFSNYIQPISNHSTLRKSQLYQNTLRPAFTTYENGIYHCNSLGKRSNFATGSIVENWTNSVNSTLRNPPASE